jgi:hypothetical protein
MVSATRWRQDHHSAPNNPNQKIRYFPTFPSGGGGFSAFGWSPIPFGDEFQMTGSPAGYMTAPGLSGALGAPLLPSFSGVAKVVGAIAGVAAGLWLAKRNIEG